MARSNIRSFLNVMFNSILAEPLSESAKFVYSFFYVNSVYKFSCFRVHVIFKFIRFMFLFIYVF